MSKQLSPRDQRILDLLHGGESVTQTARVVGVSARTVGRVRDANTDYKPTATPTKAGPVVKTYSGSTKPAPVQTTEPVAPTQQSEPTAPTADTPVPSTTTTDEEYDYLVTKSAITIIRCADSASFVVNCNNKIFPQVRKMILVDGDYVGAIELIDKKELLRKYVVGLLAIENGELRYAGTRIDSRLATRIISDIENGKESYKNLANFMDRAMNNISSKSVDELWDFIAHTDISINEDGFIVGWKKVRKVSGRADANYVDAHTGRIPNDLGSTVYMPRALVDDNRNETCSQGLHVGAWSYVPSFSGDTILRVIIDPADVVSVPKDYNGAKMRVGKYYIDAIVDHRMNELTVATRTGKVVKTGPAGYYVVENPGITQ